MKRVKNYKKRLLILTIPISVCIIAIIILVNLIDFENQKIDTTNQSQKSPKDLGKSFQEENDFIECETDSDCVSNGCTCMSREYFQIWIKENVGIDYTCMTARKCVCEGGYCQEE